jgi:metallo-beta-lactamase class B
MEVSVNTKMTLCAIVLSCSAVSAYAVPPTAPVDSHSPITWAQKQKPFRIYGNSYYVGSRGLSAILVTSPEGHVLIDGTLPENATMIESNIRALGFRVQDIKLILNTHTHFDHAGAIAAIAHDSGAQVAASAESAKALELGGDDPDDPQRGMVHAYPKVSDVRIVTDGETVRVGPLALQMHAMPGHMPGSTGWTWRSCEDDRCLSMVYADSISLLTNHDYRYTDPARPERIAGYRRTLSTLSTLPCDILLIPHPPRDFFERAARIAPGKPNPLIDTQACKAYAQEGQRNLQQRLRMEAGRQTAH